MEEWVVNVWSIHATPSRNLRKTSQLHFTPRPLNIKFHNICVLDEMVKLFGIKGNKIALKMAKQTRIVIQVIHVKNNFDQANIGNNILNIGKTSQTIWTMSIISPSTTQSLFSMK